MHIIPALNKSQYWLKDAPHCLIQNIGRDLFLRTCGLYFRKKYRNLLAKALRFLYSLIAHWCIMLLDIGKSFSVNACKFTRVGRSANYHFPHLIFT